MIIFCNKDTGKIYGVTLGRLHTAEELATDIIPSNVAKEEIRRVVLNKHSTMQIEKHLETQKTTIMDYKVVFAGREGLQLLPKDPLPPTEPNSTHTIVIDLTQSEEALLASFSETTRRYIKKSEKLEFREYGFNQGRELAIEVFKELEDKKDLHIGMQQLRIRAPFLDGLRRLYIVTQNGKPLATAIITPRFKRFVYTIAAVNEKGRELHAGDRLVWGLMQDAKYLGFTEFDFGGIFTGASGEEMQKVNDFKFRWGGTQQPMT
jgi:lipid II:glycine glycyltransferase (peptidoglycan interpeptide bridge formation enzyme)